MLSVIRIRLYAKADEAINKSKSSIVIPFLLKRSLVLAKISMLAEKGTTETLLINLSINKRLYSGSLLL